MKQCSKCLEVKSLNDFTLTKKGSTVRRASCKECAKKAHEVWRSQNQDKIRPAWNRASSKYYAKDPDKVNLWKGYGMTIEEFNILLEKQNGQCAICHREKRLAVDHCHETGRIRGLLCFRCNGGLGALGDSVDGLQRAIEYLAAGQVTG